MVGKVTGPKGRKSMGNIPNILVMDPPTEIFVHFQKVTSYAFLWGKSPKFPSEKNLKITLWKCTKKFFWGEGVQDQDNRNVP